MFYTNFMAQKSKKKNNKVGFIFWLVFAIIIILIFVLAKNKIAKVLNDTNFIDEVIGKDSTSITELINPEKTSTDKDKGTVLDLQIPEEVERSESELTERSEVIEKTEKTEKTTTEKIVEKIIPKETEKQPEKQQDKVEVKKMKLNLCFVVIDSEGSVLRKETVRQVEKNSSPLTTAINILLEGPSLDELDKKYISLIPEGTKLLSATVSNKTATLNFNENFSFNKYGVQGYLGQLMQIVYTATSFATIDKVQFLIEGQKIEYLGGEGVWIGSPLTRISFN